MGAPLTSGKAKQTHVLVYGAIEAHSHGSKGCIASNKTIGEETGLSASRVASVISELAASGWILVDLNEKFQRTSITPLLTLATSGNPPCRVGQPPLATSGNIDSSKENTIRKDVASAPAHDNEKDQLLRLNELLGRKLPPRALDKPRAKLRVRLLNFTFEELEQAAKNIFASDFMVKGNYNTLELLLRNDDKTQEWLERTPEPIKKVFA